MINSFYKDIIKIRKLERDSEKEIISISQKGNNFRQKEPKGTGHWQPGNSIKNIIQTFTPLTALQRRSLPQGSTSSQTTVWSGATSKGEHLDARWTPQLCAGAGTGPS